MFTGITLLYLGQRKTEKPSNSILSENLEALSFNEAEYLKVEKRTDFQCGLTGNINTNVFVVKVNAEGKAYIDGGVICEGTGEIYCRPVECIELYQIIVSAGS